MYPADSARTAQARLIKALGGAFSDHGLISQFSIAIMSQHLVAKRSSNHELQLTYIETHIRKSFQQISVVSGRFLIVPTLVLEFASIKRRSPYVVARIYPDCIRAERS
jgi:hypothetical protein